MSTPTQNSNGQLVWNPSVGLYASAAENQRESYGGIVGALQDAGVQSGFPLKSYPQNFAGIIAAIQDLGTFSSPPPVLPGPNPGGGEVDPNTGEWVQISTPVEGALWFDTRQGRMFVYIGAEWIQTNGADGLPNLTNDSVPPSIDPDPAPGQFWYDKANNDLYIFDGEYVDINGNIVPANTPGASPRWRLINTASATTLQTTSTVPIAQPTGSSATYSNPVVLNDFTTQTDFNVWSLGEILSIEQLAEEKTEVVVASSSPANPYEGMLWYDTGTLKLNVYTTEWVEVIPPADFTTEFAAVTATIVAEAAARTASINQVYTAINNVDISSNSTVLTLEQSIANLQTTASNIANGAYQTSTSITAELDALDAKIDNLNIPAAPDLTPYATTAALSTLSTQVGDLPTQADLSAVSASIPNVSSYVVQADIDQSIAALSTVYLPRDGGTINGSFVINKTDYNAAALDFSISSTSSNKAFKFLTQGATAGNYNTYGTTSDLWEQAWQFASEEDFCWIYNDTNKVFSITKDGPACSQLYIGDFQTNDANGRQMTNVIDVKSVLTSLQNDVSSIAGIQADITALEGRHQIYYSDTAPTTATNGDLWFESGTLRLLVRHNGAWIFPDRVEDNTLKTNLLNAINSSIDYSSLKTNLITALS